ncbi:MAG: nuclear transport factor 2 family protein [Pseudolabrys sp.]
MTPDQIRELLIMSYKAYDAGNREFVMDLFDDDIEWNFYSAPEALPIPNRVRGKINVLMALKTVDDILEFAKNDIQRIVVEGDTAATIIDQTLKLRQNGRVMRYKVAAFHRYSNGRLIEYTAFGDGVDMLQQALGRELELPVAYPS